MSRLVAQMVKNLPAMQETQETPVRSLGWEDPLEKEVAIHSSILVWDGHDLQLGGEGQGGTVTTSWTEEEEEQGSSRKQI